MQRARLIPGLTEMFILLFADDVVWVSDTVCGYKTR